MSSILVRTIRQQPKNRVGTTHNVFGIHDWCSYRFLCSGKIPETRFKSNSIYYPVQTHWKMPNSRRISKLDFFAEYQFGRDVPSRDIITRQQETIG